MSGYQVPSDHLLPLVPVELTFVKTLWTCWSTMSTTHQPSLIFFFSLSYSSISNEELSQLNTDWKSIPAHLHDPASNNFCKFKKETRMSDNYDWPGVSRWDGTVGRIWTSPTWPLFSVSTRLCFSVMIFVHNTMSTFELRQFSAQSSPHQNDSTYLESRSFAPSPLKELVCMTRYKLQHM